jgi:hypothetical protein
MRLNITGTPGAVNAVFDLQTGCIVSSSTPAVNTGGNLCSAGIKNCGNDWFLCYLTFKSATTATSTLYIKTSCEEGTYSYAGIASFPCIALWGCNVIDLSIYTAPKTHVPTAGSTVTTIADSEFVYSATDGNMCAPASRTGTMSVQIGDPMRRFFAWYGSSIIQLYADVSNTIRLSIDSLYSGAIARITNNSTETGASHLVDSGTAYIELAGIKHVLKFSWGGGSNCALIVDEFTRVTDACTPPDGIATINLQANGESTLCSHLRLWATRQ